jgi:hypothetical protein
MRTILKCKRFSFVFDLCQLNRKILHYRHRSGNRNYRLLLPDGFSAPVTLER